MNENKGMNVTWNNVSEHNESFGVRIENVSVALNEYEKRSHFNND